MVDRGGWRRRWTGWGLVAVLALAACTGDGEDDDERLGGPAGMDGPIKLEPPPRRVFEDLMRVSTRGNDALTAVASKGRRAVAGGASFVGQTELPVFLLSTDGGRSWSAGEVVPDPEDEVQAAASPSSLAAGGSGWVAVGEDREGRPALWRSADGRSWSRVPTSDSPGAFRRGDEIADVTFGAGRFFATGTASRAGADDAAVLWSSADGARWRRHPLGGVPAGSAARALAVAVHGTTVVAGGQVVPAGDDDYVGFWTGSVNGKGFGLRSLPRTRGQFTDPTLNGQVMDVSWGPGGFIAALQTDGNNWAGGLATSSDGRSWTQRAVGDSALEAQLDSAEAEDFRRVRWSGRRLLVSAVRQGSLDSPVAVGGSPESLRRIGHRSLAGAGEQIVMDVTAVPGGYVMSGFDDRAGRQVGRLWLVRGETVTPVRLGDIIPSGEGFVVPKAVVDTADGAVVPGNMGRSPLAWDWHADDTVTGLGLSGRSVNRRDVDVVDGVAVGRQGVVVLGTGGYSYGSEVMIWRRTAEPGHASGDSAPWEQVYAEVLTPLDSEDYHYYTAGGIAARKRLVVVAATSSADGDSQALPLFSTDGGDTWRHGRGRRAGGLADDGYVTQWREFRNPDPDGNVTAFDVTATQAGFVMSGWFHDPAKGTSRPVIWRSADGRIWSRPVTLPAGPGRSADVRGISSTDDRLVAVGLQRVSPGSTIYTPTAWVSEDDGRSWSKPTRLVPDGGEGRVAEVITVPGGVVVLGGLGSEATADLAAWHSTDGVTWSEFDTGLPDSDGPGEQRFLAGAVVGDVLRVAYRNAPPTGDGAVYLADLPLR